MAMTSDGTHSRTQSVLHFAEYLQPALDQPVDDIPALATHLEALASSSLYDATHEERSQLHRIGVEIWNKCRRDDNDESTKHKTFLAQVRAFAYLILTKPTESTSLRAARACIDTEQYFLASSILERISESSSHEYALLRVLLAWKQDKPSIADFFSSKLSDVDVGDAKEKTINLFYDIGTSCLDREQYEEAKKWLERAYDILQKHDWRSTFDGPELQFNVLHTYTRSLFALSDHHEAAGNLLATLDAEYPQRLPVSVLRMEHYADAKDLRTTLEGVMQSMQLTNSNFQLVLHHVHVLRKMNVEYACKALGNFILRRLVPEGMLDWTETSTLTLIWMITQDHDTYGKPESLNEALSTLWQVGQKPPLSPEASQGALVLIWRRIEQACKTNAPIAVKWCRAALVLAHQADLKGVQCEYEAKLTRRLVSCCIAAEDYATARDVLDKLSEDMKSHHLTRYLAYIVAMRSNDEAMAERALSGLASTAKDADKLLFACVSETAKYGSSTLQAKIFQRILDVYSIETDPDVNISALLRATARLLWEVLEQGKDAVDEEILERLCAVFNAAKNHSIKCNGEQPIIGQSFTVLECEWFSKNGYNLALKMVQHWPLKYVSRILEDIANLKYPASISSDLHDQFSQRIKKIAYVRIILYTTEARSGDVEAYTKAMTVYTNTIVTRKYDELFAPLLPLIFEAALYSNRHSRQGTLNHLLTVLTLDSPKAYAACADMILSATMASDETHLPIDAAVQLLNRIISQVRMLPGYDTKRASRWIRCVVQLIIDTSKGSAAITGMSILSDILDQAAQIVQDVAYPSEELEWLATTTFNLAVDLFIAEKDDAGKQMAEKALVLADAMVDKALAAMLREKIRRIGWC